MTKQFEAALCEYTGAPFAVATTSCTAALLLACAWHLDRGPTGNWFRKPQERELIDIPKHTYVGVPMSIMHAGGRPTFRDETWVGAYQLKPLPVWDSARWFTKGMYVGTNLGSRATPFQNRAEQMVCVSFHWAKTLGVQQGGAILHDNPEADRWLRMARFDGRQEGVHPKAQQDWIVGWHAYMSPEVAAAGLMRLALLPKHNEPLPWGPGTDSEYPDLSTLEIFR